MSEFRNMSNIYRDFKIPLSPRDFMICESERFDNAVYFLEEGAKICIGTTNNQGHQSYHVFEHTTDRNYLGIMINRHDIKSTEITVEQALLEKENGSLVVEHGVGVVMVGAAELYDNGKIGEFYAGVSLTTSNREEDSLVPAVNLTRMGGTAFRGLDGLENSYFIKREEQEDEQSFCEEMAQ